MASIIPLPFDIRDIYGILLLVLLLVIGIVIIILIAKVLLVHPARSNNRIRRLVPY